MLRLVIWPSMMVLGWTERPSYEPWNTVQNHTNVSNFETVGGVPQNHKLLKFFWFPWYSLKWANIAIFYLSFFQIVGAWRDFTVVTKRIKNVKSLYGFGGRWRYWRHWMENRANVILPPMCSFWKSNCGSMKGKIKTVTEISSPLLL